MARLIDPKNTIAVLQKYGLHPHKRFGQNFLIDSHVLEKIIRAAELTPEDRVLEIGPGIGTLTEALAENAGEVFAVEIDETLIPILQDTLAEYDNVTVMNEDILKVDFQEISEGSDRPWKVVANLPYYITTPIIMTLLEGDAPIESVTVMVQKEVADRMQAGPGTKDYGALSLAVQYYAEPYLAAVVPPNCFLPRPDVTSAVIHLKKRETPPVEAKDRELLFALIRASFNERRKTLQNGLKNAGIRRPGSGAAYTKEEIGKAVLSLGKGASVRGETLTLEEFARLADVLTES